MPPPPRPSPPSWNGSGRPTPANVSSSFRVPVKAGRGAACRRAPRRPYGIELSEDRATTVCDPLPEGQSLAPADFLRTAISYRSFSIVCLYPPYDYATGEQGRVETQFIERATHLLVDNGVLALVCPARRGRQLPDRRVLRGAFPSGLGHVVFRRSSLTHSRFQLVFVFRPSKRPRSSQHSLPHWLK